MINVHPSLLPQYRGSSPIQYALLNNDTITGVSVIEVAEKMDQGDILKQSKMVNKYFKYIFVSYNFYLYLIF
jgi:methionyl-tRNA formyltransferase